MTSFEGDGCFAPEKEVYYDSFNFESFNTFFEDYAADMYHPDYIIGKEVDKLKSSISCLTKSNPPLCTPSPSDRIPTYTNLEAMLHSAYSFCAAFVR